jgi:hypothetical protein
MSFPCTFRGIADWADQFRTGVLIYTLAMGFLIASVVGWFLWTKWLPVWESSLAQLPAGSVIEKQRFATPTPTSVSLTSNRFISISVRTDPQSEISATSDVRVILDESDLRVGSLFGYMHLPYPEGYIIDLDPVQLQPWWLSRSYFFYLGGFTLIWIGFSVLWRVIAAIYWVPVFILTYLWGRTSSVGTIFRLNLLSLMPPALFMTVALALYGLEQLNLQEFLVANAIHIPMGWGIILLSVRKLEVRSLRPSTDSSESKKTRTNPFDSNESNQADRNPRNPFGTSE